MQKEAKREAAEAMIQKIYNRNENNTRNIGHRDISQRTANIRDEGVYGHHNTNLNGIGHKCDNDHNNQQQRCPGSGSATLTSSDVGPMQNKSSYSSEAYVGRRSSVKEAPSPSHVLSSRRKSGKEDFTSSENSNIDR